jgi:hypothetical protein
MHSGGAASEPSKKGDITRHGVTLPATDDEIQEKYL